MRYRYSVQALVLLTLPFQLVAGEKPAIPRPTHVHNVTLGTTPETRFFKLVSFCIGTDGNLYGCDNKAIKVISPDGKLVKRWRTPFYPGHIACAPDGVLYVGGWEVVNRKKQAVLVRLDKDGKVAKDARGFRYISAIAATDRHVYVAFAKGWKKLGRGEVVRYDRDLGNPKLLAKNMRGCCSRLDIAAADGQLYIAENGRKRVHRLDAEGKVLATWGKTIRDGWEGFATCCNPMNIAVGPNGEVYTAEAGLGRIKRFSPDGKLVGFVGDASTKRYKGKACSSIPVAVSKDGRLVFVQDVIASTIKVLTRKGY